MKACAVLYFQKSDLNIINTLFEIVNTIFETVHARIFTTAQKLPDKP